MRNMTYPIWATALLLYLLFLGWHENWRGPLTQDEIEKISGLLVDKGITFEFKDRALSEEAKAAKWRNLSVLTIAFTLFWLMGSVFGLWVKSEQAEHANVVFLVQQAAVTIVLLLGTAYFSKQSAVHRNEGRAAYRTAMELNAIGPYLNSLPQERQHELKEKMAEKFFARGGTGFEVDQNFEAISVNELVKAIMSAIKK